MKNTTQLIGSIAVAIASLLSANASEVEVKATPRDAIRPFHFKATDAQLAELRRRIKATQWPEKETVNDLSQGVPLATMQELARHWATDYDWRKVEAKLAALPQFITEIDGVDIHFIHVRSKHPNALPVIVCHGDRKSTRLNSSHANISYAVF